MRSEETVDKLLETFQVVIFSSYDDPNGGDAGISPCIGIYKRWMENTWMFERYSSALLISLTSNSRPLYQGGSSLKYLGNFLLNSK
jgi:hypothetical protein